MLCGLAFPTSDGDGRLSRLSCCGREMIDWVIDRPGGFLSSPGGEGFSGGFPEEGGFGGGMGFRLFDNLV